MFSIEIETKILMISIFEINQTADHGYTVNRQRQKDQKHLQLSYPKQFQITKVLPFSLIL